MRFKSISSSAKAIQLHQFGPTLWGHETPFDVKRVNFHAQLHRVSLCISRGRVCRARIFPKPRAPTDRHTKRRKVRVGRRENRRGKHLSSRAVRVYLLRGVFFLAPSRVMPNTYTIFTLCFSPWHSTTQRASNGEWEERERNAIEMRRFPKTLTHPAPVNIGRRSQRACVKFIWNFRGFRFFHSLQTLYAVENYHSTLQIILYA